MKRRKSFLFLVVANCRKNLREQEFWFLGRNEEEAKTRFFLLKNNNNLLDQNRDWMKKQFLKSQKSKTSLKFRNNPLIISTIPYDIPDYNFVKLHYLIYLFCHFILWFSLFHYNILMLTLRKRKTN